MNFAKRNKSIVDFLFILTLFGAFAVSALFVLVFGSRIYERTASDMQVNFEKRTALSYITEKVRSHDFGGGVEVDDFDLNSATDGNHSVLKLYQTVGGKEYVTYMFVADGYLKEFTSSSDYEFDYESGTKILPIKEFSVKKVGDALYRFDVVDENGENTDFFVTLYSASDGENINE